MKKTWVIASEPIANNVEREFFVNYDGKICQELKIHSILTYDEIKELIENLKIEKSNNGFDIENVNHSFISQDLKLCDGKLAFCRSDRHRVYFLCECGEEISWSWMEFIQYYSR